LLIVTHSPNIVVYANTDNVVCLDFVEGQLIVAGNYALKDKQIRYKVCKVMEVGREALNKRYY
jgi:Fe-S cluster assembly ATPase SufC